jgi:hypothetical protein
MQRLRGASRAWLSAPRDRAYRRPVTKEAEAGDGQVCRSAVGRQTRCAAFGAGNVAGRGGADAAAILRASAKQLLPGGAGGRAEGLNTWELVLL